MDPEYIQLIREKYPRERVSETHLPPAWATKPVWGICRHCGHETTSHASRHAVCAASVGLAACDCPGYESV